MKIWGLSANGRIKLKWSSKYLVLKMWTELIWLKTGSLTACEYGNYPSSSIQKKQLLTIWGEGVLF
jgi:hypothetical protein